MNEIYIGFRGKNNASGILVQSLAGNRCLLTNSFAGLKKDMETLEDSYDCAILFGVDKNLKGSVRIEKTAENGEGMKLRSALDLRGILARFGEEGITSDISDNPTHYLCNEAYWHALQKFHGKAVLIHIPTVKYLDSGFLEKMKRSFEND